MRVLILGGTRFIGRHLVTQALQRGHDLTLLCRGRTPSPFAGVIRHVFTDRRALTAEATRVLREPWDAVFDTCASNIDHVRSTRSPLRESAATYVLLSSCGVYRPGRAGLSERSATIRADHTDPARASPSRKLRAERYVARHIGRGGARLIIARLGVVVGRYDPSDRLAYWLERALRGGPLLVPMDPDQPLQLIDVDDVARFLLDTMSSTVDGVVNLSGPRRTAAEVIDAILAQAGRDGVPHWVGEEFALHHGLQPWTQVPLWLPWSVPQRALMNIDSSRAQAAGLTYRPLDDSIAECLSWQTERRGWPSSWLSPQRERELLDQWQD